MAWALTATGDCPPEYEANLATELADLLAGYGATASQMSAETINGPVHVPAPEPKAKKGKSDAAASDGSHPDVAP
jgi:hypothetical protein